MNEKRSPSAFPLLALAAISLGVALVIAAIFADSLGISGGGQGVGWKQLIAAIAGLIIAFAGVGRLIQSNRIESG